MKKIIFITSFLILLVSCSSNDLKDQTPEEKKAELYYGQGTSALVKKDYLEALTYLLKAKELTPKDSQIRNNLGMAYYFRGEHKLAETELKEAIALDEKNTDAKLNLGTLYFEKKRNKDARHLYEQALENLTYANQYRTYFNLALVDLAEGDRKSAFLNLNKSVSEKEDYCTAHFKLGELYSEEYRFKEALSSFREAGKGTCVNEAAPYYQQGISLINLDRKTEAKKKFQELLTKFPNTKFSKMAIQQIKTIENSSAREEESFTNNKQQTEVISNSPKF